MEAHRLIRFGGMRFGTEGEAAEGFGAAEEGAGRLAVPDLLSFVSALLAREFEAGVVDTSEAVLVMQRRVESRVGGGAYAEVDVAEAKRRGAAGVGVGGTWSAVFSGAEEPEEGDNDEVDGVSIEGPEDSVISVEGGWHAADDGDVARVGASCGAILAAHGFEESAEYGREALAAILESGIPPTQVGDALADGQERFLHGISPHGDTGLAEAAVPDAVDQEQVDSFFRVRGLTEGAGEAQGVAELGPVAEELGFRAAGLGNVGSGGEVESSAEVSSEACSTVRESMRHGLGCG